MVVSVLQLQAVAAYKQVAPQQLFSRFKPALCKVSITVRFATSKLTPMCTWQEWLNLLTYNSVKWY